MQIRHRKMFFTFFAVAVSLFLLPGTVWGADYVGEYWNLPSLSGASPAFPTGTPAVSRTDSVIDFSWGEGSPDSAINADDFAARWTKTENLLGGSYTFTASVDDGVRVYVDDDLILDSWIDQGTATYTATSNIEAGEHTIKVEFYENGGGAVIQFSYDGPPGISSLSPALGAANILPTDDLVATFTENVTAVSGKNIYIKKTSDDSTVETIAANDTSKVTISDTTVTINPATDLDEQVEYYVLIDSGAFKDGVNKTYAGISSKADWSFTIADITHPTVVSFTPANGSTDIALDQNLAIEFSENVDIGRGSFYLYKKEGDELVEEFSASHEGVTGNLTTIITANPTANLEYDTNYYVLTGKGAFCDASGNFYPGIPNKTTWAFKTIVAPETPTPTPASEPSKSDTSSHSEPLPDPVQAVTVSNKKVTNDASTNRLSKIETKPDEKFTLNVKAPDADQVKSVIVKIDNKTYKLAANTTDSNNPAFAVKLGISKPGKYAYTVITNYGSTTRSTKGTVIVRGDNKKEIPLAPMPLVAVTGGGPGVRFYSPPAPKPTPKVEVVEQLSDKQKEVEVAVVSPSPLPSIEPSFQPTPMFVSPKEEMLRLSWASRASSALKEVGNAASTGVVSTSQSLADFVKNASGQIAGSATQVTRGVVTSLSNQTRTLATLFEQKPDHVYRKVTVKLAMADGTPLTGASVTLFSEPKTAVTNNEGQAEFYNIESGKHQLKITHQGYTSKQSLEITEPVTEVTINITANFNKGWRLPGF